MFRSSNSTRILCAASLALVIASPAVALAQAAGGKGGAGPSAGGGISGGGGGSHVNAIACIAAPCVPPRRPRAIEKVYFFKQYDCRHYLDNISSGTAQQKLEKYDRCVQDKGTR